VQCRQKAKSVENLSTTFRIAGSTRLTVETRASKHRFNCEFSLLLSIVRVRASRWRGDGRGGSTSKTVAKKALAAFRKRRRGFPVSTETKFPLIFQTFKRGSNSRTTDGGLVEKMIIRARHDKDGPYFRLRDATAQDIQLSWAARGVIAYVFSKPDNWEVRVEDLTSQGDMGRNAIYRILGELQQLGYIHRYKERLNDGRIGRWVMDVYETPHAQFEQLGEPHDQNRDVGEPDVQNGDLATPHAHIPHVGNPHVDLPHVGNGHNINKRDLKRREIKKEERQQPIAAAAGVGKAEKESLASRFSLDQIEPFIRATKPHKTEAQIGGLARHLQRTGEEDELIAEWQARRILAQAHVDHPEDCDLCQGTRWQVIPGRGARPCPNLLLKELPE
jgi:hypothetical protein